MKYIVNVKKARKKKLHHIAAETAVRRHKAVMEGIQHRDERLRAIWRGCKAPWPRCPRQRFLPCKL